MKIDREKFLNFSGLFLISLAIFNLYFKIYYGFGHEILWLCNNAPIFIGIGLLLRNQKMVLGIFALLFAGSLGWNLGAASFLIFGENFLGGNLFKGMNLILIIGTILNHFLTFLISFVSIFLINKKEKFAWVYGLAYGLILVGFALIFQERNYNCILDPCTSFIPNFKFYPIIYMISHLILFMMPFNWLINKFMRK